MKKLKKYFDNNLEFYKYGSTLRLVENINSSWYGFRNTIQLMASKGSIKSIPFEFSTVNRLYLGIFSIKFVVEP
ncbi:hypothetical protein [Chryseobacterium shandongense]|uniref:hypothetical protein n=1 Tax=Chryseobacterium shandongense TaxID=1493872 RepID=UPI003743C591